MKKNLWSKIIILIVMFFFVIPTLSPAQELTKLYEPDDNIWLKAANNINSYVFFCDTNIITGSRINQTL